MDEIRARAIALYDDFTHTHLDRRRFLADLTRLTGSLAAAQTLAATIAADPAAAALVEPTDGRIKANRIVIPGAGELLKGYFVVPTGPLTLRPSILVIHENRGLNAHIEDIARRLGVAGFNALAVDFLSPQGGTPKDEDAAREKIGALDLAHTADNGVAALKWLQNNKRGTGKVGAVGFCWGGGMVNRIAVAAGSLLDAGVAYYGPTPNSEEAASVKAAMLLHYAGNDDRVNGSAGAWVDALRKAGVRVARYDYPGTEHAFNNDTSAARYNRSAATLAWDRTIAFFRKTLA